MLITAAKWTAVSYFFFFFQAEDGIRDYKVTGVQTCALPILQVRLRGAHGDLRIAQPAQRGVDRGPAWRDVGHIGDEHRVGSCALGLPAQQVEQHAAAVFLLALDEEAEVHGRSAAALLNRLEQAEHLALVIRRATREQLAVAHRRLEWRRGPLVQRLGWLHVVVTVDEQRGRAGHLGPDAPHHRVRAAREELYPPTAKPTQLAGDPFRGPPARGVVGP